MIPSLKIEKSHVPNLSNSSSATPLLFGLFLSFFFPKHFDPSSNLKAVFTQCRYSSLLTFCRAIFGGLKINEYPISQFPVQSVCLVLRWGVVGMSTLYLNLCFSFHAEILQGLICYCLSSLDQSWPTF